MDREHSQEPLDLDLSDDDSFERSRQTSLSPIRLGTNSHVVTSLLCVPLYVLNPRANDREKVAKDSDELVYSWTADKKERTFVFKRPKGVPFPLPDHAELFYTLLAMFSTRFNASGLVHFRLIDILKNAGKNVKSKSAFERVREMIWRYCQCSVAWDAGWKYVEKWSKGQQQDTWGGPLILAQDIFSAKVSSLGGITEAQRIISDTKSNNANRWFTVTLHPAVVGAVGDHLVRRFLTQSLQMTDLSDTTKCVYRYFNGFSNLSDVSRTYDQLIKAFSFKSPRGRFRAWLIGHLEALKQKKLIERYETNDVGVVLKCAPIPAPAKIVDAELTTIETEGAESKAAPRSRADKNILKNMRDADLVDLMTSLVGAGILTVDVTTIFTEIKKTDERQAANALRDHLIARWNTIGTKVTSLIRELQAQEARIRADAVQVSIDIDGNASAHVLKRRGATASRHPLREAR